MRYVSPSGRLVGPEAAFNTGMSRREQLWDRARESVGGGRFWTALLVLLLTVTVARSTSTGLWVDGIDVIIYLAVPGAAAFATNLLDWPQDQNGYTLAMLVLTLALLLWTNYTGSIANASRANVKLTGDARWDFWESGLVAMAALIVLGIMLPPLSTADRTLDLESGVFSGWAQLQQRLSHPGIFSNGKSTGVTGFTTDVRLNGSLQRTRDVVFTYTIADYSGPKYFRGVNVSITSGGEWRYTQPNRIELRQLVAKNDLYQYAEDYEN